MIMKNVQESLKSTDECKTWSMIFKSFYVGTKVNASQPIVEPYPKNETDTVFQKYAFCRLIMTNLIRECSLA